MTSFTEIRLPTIRQRIKVLFFESGRRGGSLYRLKGILDGLHRDRFSLGFVSWYRDLAASTIFALEGLYCRHWLGLRRDPQPDVFKHIFGVPVPTPYFFHYFLASLAALWLHRPHVAYINTTIDGHQPAILAARLLRIPVVCHQRMTRQLDGDEMRFVRWVDLCVTSCRSASQLILHQTALPSGRVTHVYDGIDLDRFDRAELRGDDFPAGRIYICLCGTLNARKRPLLALEAFRLALRDCPDLRLVVLGDGPLRPDIEAALRSHELQSHVLLLGHRDDSPAVMKSCHIGLLTSEREGFPGVVLEYMAAGLPVVVAGLPGMDEVVQDGRNGFIIEQASAESLADALRRLARSSELRQSMGAASRRRIESFTRAAEVSAVAAAIEQVARPSATLARV